MSAKVKYPLTTKDRTGRTVRILSDRPSRSCRLTYDDDGVMIKKEFDDGNIVEYNKNHRPTYKQFGENKQFLRYHPDSDVLWLDKEFDDAGLRHQTEFDTRGRMIYSKTLNADKKTYSERWYDPNTGKSIPNPKACVIVTVDEIAKRFGVRPENLTIIKHRNEDADDEW